jgi:hypothetical protein
MNIFRWLRTSFFARTALAIPVLAAILLLFGAEAASARPICYERPRTRVVIVERGFYGPRVVYHHRVAPYYRVYPRPVVRRYWDVRFHCWRYYR